MKKLIVIKDTKKYQYDDIQDLIKNFINQNYFNMSEEEKFIELEKKTIANTVPFNIKIVNLQNNFENFDKNAFILYDEFTYILSMLRFNIIILLERIDSNIFGKYLDTKKMKDNYIIVNTFADEIMKNYLQDKNEIKEF